MSAPSPQPALRHPPELLLAAQGPVGAIRVAVFDVDGVLTDGRLHFGADGEALKVFHVRDGLGLKLLRDGGIEPVVVTGRDSSALRRRLAELGMAECHFGVSDKLAAVQAILDSRGMAWSQCAAIGDDWPDLPLLRRAGFACVPADAHVEARALAHHVTSACGGKGAAREFCDLLLMAAGRYAALWRAVDPQATP